MITKRYLLTVEIVLAAPDHDTEGQAGFDRKINSIIEDVKNGELPSWCIRSNAKVEVKEVI